jgi:hypothetical protein
MKPGGRCEFIRAMAACRRPSDLRRVEQAGSNNVADLTDAFEDLDAFKASGAKMITVVGTNGGLIMPSGVINYYRVTLATSDKAQSNLIDDIPLTHTQRRDG